VPRHDSNALSFARRCLIKKLCLSIFFTSNLLLMLLDLVVILFSLVST